MVPADHPTELRRRCEEEAQQMVQLSNSTRDGQQGVTNSSLTHLISRLTALLLQIKVEHEEMLGTYLIFFIISSYQKDQGSLAGIFLDHNSEF